MGRRTKARECALQMLYQAEITGEPLSRVSAAFWKLRNGTPELKTLAERLAGGAHAMRATLDAEIESAARHWRLERIAMVERNILRLGIYELMQEPGTPSGVVLDEAIEMAKRYAESESYAFVNGVLDAVRRRVRPQSGDGERDGGRGGRSDERG